MPQVREITKALRELDLAGSKVLVIGHTHSRGSEAYNHDLSLRRAPSVVKTLVEGSGISRRILTPLGKGESQPVLVVEQREEDFAGNRRVELQVSDPR